MESIAGLLITVFWMGVAVKLLPKKRFGKWRS